MAGGATRATPSTSTTQNHDSQKPTVDALKEELPTFPSGKGSNFKDASFQPLSKSSGKSTTAAIPPVAWVAEDMESYLKTYFTNELANISANGVTPQLEESFRISNEADVVRASAVYLLNVVNIAGESFFPFSSKPYASSARVFRKSMSRVKYLPSTLFRSDCLGLLLLMDYYRHNCKSVFDGTLRLSTSLHWPLVDLYL